MLIVFFGFLYHAVQSSEKEPQELDFSEFLAQVDAQKATAGIPDMDALAQRSGKGSSGARRIDTVTVKGLDYEGTFTDGSKFKTRGPAIVDSALLNRVTEGGIKLRYEPEEQSSLAVQILVQWVPMLLLFGVFFFFMRQLQSGGGKAMSFGKSKARRLSEESNKITFADVAGIDEAKEELEEIIEFLKAPKKFQRLGGRIPKGVLLMGPPGTGKTLMARAIAGEANVPFFSISGSDFVEMFVGVGASRVRDLFEQGKKSAPCIIFIDEIDAVGRHRGAGLGGGHDEREQTLNQLLVEMDGFEANDGVILVAATNRPDVLDPALLRPGRFDRRIMVPRPDVKGRLGILKVHTKQIPLVPEVDLEVIARGTPGFSGADLENLVNESALLAARHDKERVDMGDFESAKDKVLMGVERKSMIISDEQKGITAIHEAGHALVARLLPGTDPVHKVTIIPRGPALGLTQQLPAEDRYGASRNFLLKDIAILLGGRIAEELARGEITTGASNDIERATDLARRMVCEWGMSDKLGPLAFGQKEEEIFLGREISRSQNYSPETAIQIDAEVKAIVMRQYEVAKELLSANRDALDRITAALLEFETIDSTDIDTLMSGGTIQRGGNKAEPPKAAQPTPTDSMEREKQKVLDAIDGLTIAPSKAAG
jgi:cell division protease FtsH